MEVSVSRAPCQENTRDTLLSRFYIRHRYLTLGHNFADKSSKSSHQYLSQLYCLDQRMDVKNRKEREMNYFTIEKYVPPSKVCHRRIDAYKKALLVSSEYIPARDPAHIWQMTSHLFLQVLVDRVRAGVMSSWLPRRLGGGLGQRQKGTQRFAWKVRLHV